MPRGFRGLGVVSVAGDPILYMEPKYEMCSIFEQVPSGDNVTPVDL